MNQPIPHRRPPCVFPAATGRPEIPSNISIDKTINGFIFKTKTMLDRNDALDSLLSGVASSLKCDKTCSRSATVYREKDISVSMQTLNPQEEGACVGTEMSGGQPLPSCRTSHLNAPGITRL